MTHQIIDCGGWQIQPLIWNLGIYHHITEDVKPMQRIKFGDTKVTNPNFALLVQSDGLLVSVDVLSFIFSMDTTFYLWQAIEEHLFPAIKEKEIFLNDSLMTLKKGDFTIEDYIRKFTGLWDNLVAIGKPIGDLDKCFHLTRGLGLKCQDFCLAMLSKQPYSFFTQFTLALKAHK